MKIIGSLLARHIKKFKPQRKPKAEALPTKYTFIPKSKTFKINPKHTRVHAEPIAKRDMASAIARRRETRSHIALTKKVEDAYKRTIAKPQKANQLKQLQAKKTRALTRAFTLSQKRGMKTLEKTSKKLDVNIKRFGVQGKGSRFTDTQWISASEAKALLKKHRATLSKIYRSPKSWKQRSQLKSYYRTQAKSELGAAKVDRAYFRTQTVQKLDSKTGKYKTIRRYKI